jgi:hypothetical protein
VTDASDTQAAIAALRSEMSERFSVMAKENAANEGTLRVIKHDVANLQAAQGGIVGRMDKLEDRLGSKIDDLKLQITTLHIKHEKGVGFYAGLAVAFTTSAGVIGTLLMLLYKQLFGDHA